MIKKKTDIGIRSSAVELLTFVAATGDSEENVEMCYEDENIWMTQKMVAVLYDVGVDTSIITSKRYLGKASFNPVQLFENFEQLPPTA